MEEGEKPACSFMLLGGGDKNVVNASQSCMPQDIFSPGGSKMCWGGEIFEHLWGQSRWDLEERNK